MILEVWECTFYNNLFFTEPACVLSLHHSKDSFRPALEEEEKKYLGGLVKGMNSSKW